MSRADRSRGTVGRVGRADQVSRILEGLRAGTCHLVAELPVGARVDVGLSGGELSWLAALPYDFLPGDEEWMTDTLGRELMIRCADRDVILGRGHVESHEAHVDESGWVGWTRGTAGEVVVDPSRSSSEWLAGITSGDLPEHTVAASGHTLSMRSRPRGRSASFELRTGVPVDARAAADILEEVFLPMIRLLSPSPVVVSALWSFDELTGFAAFDASTRSLGGHRLVAVDDVPACLDAILAGFVALDVNERRVASIMIDMLLFVCEPALEPSIALASAAMELASKEWGPGAGIAHEVPADARQAIIDAFVAAAQLHAPGTGFAANASGIASNTFSLPARERFNALLDHLGVAADEDGVAQFVRVRNRIAHSGFQQLPLEDRVRALMFGRWVLASCVLRKLGFLGPIADLRMPFGT